MRFIPIVAGLSVLGMVSASPFSGYHHAVIRDESVDKSACPNITVASVNVGTDCGPGTQIRIDQDAHSFTVTFDLELANTTVSQASVNCTIIPNLEYPLPIPAGCLNTGSFYILDTGDVKLLDGDTAVRVNSIDFIGGPNAHYFTDSASQSFTRQYFEVDGPRGSEDDFPKGGGLEDQAYTNFTFGPDPSGSGSNAGPQSLVSLAMYYQLDLTATHNSNIEVYVKTEVLNFVIVTYGTDEKDFGGPQEPATATGPTELPTSTTSVTSDVRSQQTSDPEATTTDDGFQPTSTDVSSDPTPTDDGSQPASTDDASQTTDTDSDPTPTDDST